MNKIALKKPVAVAHTSKSIKWVYKATKSVIVVCSCGNKYIKTRDRQKVCLKCLSGHL